MSVAKKLRLGAGYNEGTDVGPMISPEAKQRAERLITSAEEQARARVWLSLLLLSVHMRSHGCSLFRPVQLTSQVGLEAV